MQLDTPPGVRPACGAPSLAVTRDAVHRTIPGLEVGASQVRPRTR